MKTETTGGDVYYTIPNCDCGLTGGCPKCQNVPRSRYTEYAPPEPTTSSTFWIDIDESKFRDPKLEAFLRKKGYITDED